MVGIRRFAAVCRRVLLISLATFALLSLSGPFRQSTTDVENVSQNFVNYSVCGLVTPAGSRDVASRLAERIKCRSQLGVSEPAVSSTAQRKNLSQPLFVTHDLFNAVGLGNFMFMAGALLGLAESSGRKPFFLDYHHHMGVFGRKFPMAEHLPPAQFSSIPDGVLTQNVLEIKAAGIHDVDLSATLSIDRKKTEEDEEIPAIFALRGYFQSWKYFHTARDLIRRQFSFSPKVSQRALAGLKSTLSSYIGTSAVIPTTIIGIHVRRGDLLKPVMKKYGHTVASRTYVTNLISNLTERYRPALFIILTNDFEYCVKNFGKIKNVRIMKGNSPEVDMAVLSLMDHLILTVGTFGWWGAYLGDADEVYYYRNWPTFGSEMDKEYNKNDYFLPHWKPAE